MSVLTQRERDGLDDVFMSIHSRRNYSLKKILSSLTFKKMTFSKKRLFLRVKSSFRKTTYRDLGIYLRKKKYAHKR